MISTNQSLSSVKTDGAFIDLLPYEVDHNMYDSSITIATTFEGNIPIDLLKTRAQEILSINPWLASRLRTNNKTKQPSLWVPAEEIKLSPFFEDVEISQVCSTGSNTMALIREAYVLPMNNKYLALFTKQGFKCLDKDEPLFKIRVCASDNGKFILLVSMSHILGDGTTLYQIYRMLDPSSAIISFEPKRVLSVKKELADSGCIPGSFWFPRSIQIKKNKKYDWLMASKAMRSNKASRALVGMTVASVEEESELKVAEFNGMIFHINLSWIKEQTQSFTSSDNNVQWISSNDVLTSWYMNASGASVGIMAVNARERVNGLKFKHAGNYQVSFPFYPDEYATPATIRMSVNKFSASLSKHGFAGKGNSVAFITNLTQYYKDLNLGSECRLLMHFPFIPQELGSPTILDTSMTIFCPREGELAATLWANNFENFMDGTALGEPFNPIF